MSAAKEARRQRNQWQAYQMARADRGIPLNLDPPRPISAPVLQSETITALVQEDVRIDGVVFTPHENPMEITASRNDAQARQSMAEAAAPLVNDVHIVRQHAGLIAHAVIHDVIALKDNDRVKKAGGKIANTVDAAVTRVTDATDKIVTPVGDALDTVLSLPVVARTTRAVGRYVGKVAPPVATGITVAACASGVGQEPTPIVIHVDEYGREIQPETTPTAVATQRPVQTAAAEQTQQLEQTATPDAPSHGLNERQENMMGTIRVRNSQGQDQGSLYDHFTSNDTSEEQRRTALGLVDLALTADQQVADPARIDAVKIARDPSLPDNVLNRDQIAFQVDGVPDESTGTLYLIVDNTIEVDGVNRSTYELIEMANNATNTQEKQRYIQLARQAGLLVYTPSEVGGQLRMAATPDGHRIMQRLDKDGNVVQETDKSALNWKVPLDAEKVFVAQGEENPFYIRENVNGGPAEAQSVYWDEDQQPLPPADFDTTGLRLSQKNGAVVYLDSAGNTVAELNNRSAESVGQWRTVEAVVEQIHIPEFTYPAMVFMLSEDGNRQPEIRSSVPLDVQYFHEPEYFNGQLLTASQLAQAYQRAGIENLAEGMCSTNPVDYRYGVALVVIGFRDNVYLTRENRDNDRNTVILQTCGVDDQGNTVPLVLEHAYTHTTGLSNIVTKLTRPNGTTAPVTRRLTDEEKQALMGTVFTIGNIGTLDGMTLTQEQSRMVYDMVNSVRGGSKDLREGNVPSVQISNHGRLINEQYNFTFDLRNSGIN